MLASFDAAQLEWRVVAHNSRDPVAIQEILDGVDFHSDNQAKFKLPSRLIAKKFLFRAIFKGSAYAYSVDNDFKHLGGDKFWQRVIDKFYDKYQGIGNYHSDLINRATKDGFIESESGRIYEFTPIKRRGQWVMPENDIVNYPVQGFAADLMKLIRISAMRRLQPYGRRVLLVNTVHDSLKFDLDMDVKQAVEIGRVVKGSFQDCGANFKRIFGKELLVPMDCDMHIGNNYLWMHNIKL
jgi:DNA polymerase I-like protein with 3'-5' exonuclease and polymerase domains